MKQNIYDNDIFFKNYSLMKNSGMTANDFIEQTAIKSAIPNLIVKLG